MHFLLPTYKAETNSHKEKMLKWASLTLEKSADVFNTNFYIRKENEKKKKSTKKMYLMSLFCNNFFNFIVIFKNGGKL